MAKKKDLPIISSSIWKILVDPISQIISGTGCGHIIIGIRGKDVVIQAKEHDLLEHEPPRHFFKTSFTVKKWFNKTKLKQIRKEKARNVLNK